MSETKPVVPGAIVPVQRAAVTIGERGIVLQNLDELMRFARICMEGGLAPKGFQPKDERNEQQINKAIGGVALAIQAGLERGLGLMGGLQAACVINGQLSWKGWAVVGFIQNSPVIVPGTWKTWLDGEGDARTGHCVAKRRGYQDLFHRTFSVKDAKVAGLWAKEGPWRTRPDNMLEWRAIGDMARFHFPDVSGNLPIAEVAEAGGYGPELEPAAQAPAAPAPPKQVVVDPVLAELLPGSLPEPLVTATFVEDIAPPAPYVDYATDQKAREAQRAEKTPEVQAEIDRQVDEALPSRPMVNDDCERCGAKLNAMAGCDVCGWPGPDNGERP